MCTSNGKYKVVPRNASYTSNGGFEDACEWACDTGFTLNEDGDTCVFIPLSNCFESTVDVDASLCSGLNFTLKGCAANAVEHQKLTQQIATWVDSYLNLPATCDEMLYDGSEMFNAALRQYLAELSASSVLSVASGDIVPAQVDFQGEGATNYTGLCGLSEGMPLGFMDAIEKNKEAPAERCLALCPLREVLVEAVLGTCVDYTHCPVGLNGTKLACCFAMTEMTESACEDYSTSVLGKYAGKGKVRGVCNSQANCVRPSDAPSTRHTLGASASFRCLVALLVLMSPYYLDSG